MFGARRGVVGRGDTASVWFPRDSPGVLFTFGRIDPPVRSGAALRWVTMTNPIGTAPSSSDALALRQGMEQGLGDARAEVVELGGRFTAAGHELALVGGCVRDLLIGHRLEDLDLTTDAPPEEVERLLRGWADHVWEVGIRFGTVGAGRAGHRFEITTYRSEAYDADSRKPTVAYGASLSDDLVRRDFTINAMAVRLPDFAFVDEHSGLADLAARRLRTPSTPTRSFSDDPLRMMRAARFVSQLGCEPDPGLVEAMGRMADRISIVSAERVRDELSKLLLTDDPRPGLELLVDSGIAGFVLPELPAMALTQDDHQAHKDVYQHSLTVLEQAIALEKDHEPVSGPDLILRLAALLHDVGKPATRRFESDGTVTFHHHDVVGAKLVRRRLRALRFPKEVVNQVSLLVELHLRFHGYAGGTWTDSAVRRYVRDAGDQLVRLHKLTRADCTTGNRRKAARMRQSYAELEARIAELADADELAATRPDLDGNQIMVLLGIGPGREVGLAYRFLLERRLDRGPVEPEVAAAELREWWATRSGTESPPA